MTLSTGTKLSHYEITSQIGKGGMGEVYQAKDTKLGRDVAIKVLPEEFARDADRVARFQREAKLLASLNHPNIAAIHGLEEADGTHFLVLELVEGQTLAERIKGGPVEVEEALKLGLQIAEALEAAHEKGVIHRDLKPANIKVTPEGKVKVLDFGLAKAYAGEQDQVSLSNSPTLSQAMTMQGVILGTAAYMSPEQARGKTVDKRADVWAFGTVLYEILTGRQAFQGEDVSETLASVIKGDTNLDLLPANIHQRIREVISRCLQKELRKRYPDIANARYEIEQVLTDPSGVFAQPSVITKSKKKLQVGISWIAVTAILSAIIVGAVAWYFKSAEPRQVVRFYHELPEDQSFTRTGYQLIAISADGTKIAYVANRQLYLRHINELTARPIQGTDEDPSNPFFSPAGQEIGFYSTVDNQLKKLSVSGGVPVTLCDADDPFGVSWGSDDTILFGQETGIMGISSNGGTAEILIEQKENESFHGPQALPGGEWVLFTTTSNSGVTRWDRAQIVLQSLKTNERRILVPAGKDARYVSTGYLVYALENVLYARAFDADKMEVTGSAVPIIEGVRRSSTPAITTGTANYGFSDMGTLVYVVGDSQNTQKRSLIWTDHEGNETQLAAQPSTYFDPKISPDGTKIALSIENEGNQDIWIWDLIRKTMKHLTFDAAIDDNPIWTPDGERIVFTSNREGVVNVYWKAADGRGDVEQLGSISGDMIVPSSWSADGKDLVLEADEDIVTISMGGNYEDKPLLKEDYVEANPQISPDGRWLAYFANEFGQFEIYVRPFPDVNSGLWHISTSGDGQEPRWSPDSRVLYYRSGDAIMMVAVEAEPDFEVGSPEELFRGTFFYRGPGHSWDIHPDGKRILMMKPSELVGETSTSVIQNRINIVLNWFEYLKERVSID